MFICSPHVGFGGAGCLSLEFQTEFTKFWHFIVPNHIDGFNYQ